MSATRFLDRPNSSRALTTTSAPLGVPSISTYTWLPLYSTCGIAPIRIKGFVLGFGVRLQGLGLGVCSLEFRVEGIQVSIF
jgi:hypothetical protein